jgi:quercetin dioxygenase-like cupin family protein
MRGWILSFAAVLLLGAAPVQARQAPPPTMTPPFKVTVLVAETPVTGAPDRVFVMLTAEFPPGIGTGRHTHPGDEYGTVLEGSVMTRHEGPGGGEWKTVNAGQSYYIPANTIHETKNNGTVPARTVNGFVVEKGKPRASPVQ